MSKKYLRKISLPSAALLGLFLSGCQTQPYYPPETNQKPRVSEVITNGKPVITGGLGINFEFTEDKLKEFGFTEDPKIENKGEYSKIDLNASFPFQTVYFTPTNPRLYQITGHRYYRSDQHRDPFAACLIDKSLLVDTIKERYNELIKIEGILDKPSENYSSDRYCEGQRISYIGTRRSEYGHQRCVSFNCLNTDKTTTLTASYIDTRIEGWKERKEYLNSIKDQRMKARSLNPDEL